MPKCIMYKDPADCSLAPCGFHCNVFVEAHKGADKICQACEQDHCDMPGKAEVEHTSCGGYIPVDKDEDTCVTCERLQGPCVLMHNTTDEIPNCLVGRC